MFDQNLIIGLVILAIGIFVVYTYAPRILSGLGMEGFTDASKNVVKKVGTQSPIKTPGANPSLGGMNNSAQVADAKVPTAVPPKGKEGFSDFQGSPYGDSGSLGPVPMGAASKPQGCYPREQISPSELLPIDTNSQWAQVNPTGSGSIQGKNFLTAGALVGVNTTGQSLRNANQQLRAEPPCPQVAVGPWHQSTIEPDLMRRPLE